MNEVVAEFNWRVDRTPPAVAVTSSEAISTDGQLKYRLYLQASEAVTSFEVFLCRVGNDWPPHGTVVNGTKGVFDTNATDEGDYM